MSTAQRGAHLLDAALDVLADGGDAALSVRSVATAAGVSPAQVQYYFRSRAELVEAVFDRAGEEFVADVGAALDGVPPRRRLRTALWRWLPLDPQRERRVRIWVAYAAVCATDEPRRARAAALEEDLRAWLADELATTDAGATRTLRRHRDAAAELFALVDGTCLHTLNLPPAEREPFAERVLGGWLARQRSSS